MTTPAADQSLARLVESRLAGAAARRITRVLVFDEVTSTQDVARALDVSGGGVMVLARRQTAGRGRLGRAWADPAEMGLAATCAFPAPDLTNAHLSLAAGLAAHAACVASLHRAPASGPLGLRWPNDVVETAPPGRKVAGVLIERDGAVALVGVGINLAQQPSDWPPHLAGRAVSLRELDPGADGLPQTAAALAVALERCLGTAIPDLAAAWQSLDTLRGTRRTFEHNARRYSGVVRRIDAASHVELLDDLGQVVRLPALTTSLIHDA